jgi:hypothetical protein
MAALGYERRALNVKWQLNIRRQTRRLSRRVHLLACSKILSRSIPAI